LTAAELAAGSRWKKELGLDDAPLVIGFNTGCSELFALKIRDGNASRNHPANRRWNAGNQNHLLGGREDTDRNQRLVEMTEA
jgi:hypothetical protein